MSSGPAPCLARRVLLLGAGAAGVLTLAGCGDDEPTGRAVSATSPEAVPARPTADPNPFATGSTPPGAGGAPPPGALVAVDEVAVGGGVVVNDATLVVQPRKGTFKAYSASCPHQGTTLEPPTPGQANLTCPSHNSQFKVADGALVRGPATRGLSPVPVKVQDGYVVEA